MVHTHMLLFAGASLLMVLTPGPNMIYLISRTLCQGVRAGLISLLGVIAGFICHMLAAAFGLSGAFKAEPLAYDAVKYLGAAYLLWLALQAFRSHAKGAFQVRNLRNSSSSSLFFIGLWTNLLNPKIIVFYLSILPQFITEERQLLKQSLQLGATQITVSLVVNFAIVLCAASINRWVSTRPVWIVGQRYLMGLVLGVLGVRMMFWG
jgi:threonine/homoserine/homoserine lactone efflux protein